MRIDGQEGPTAQHIIKDQQVILAQVASLFAECISQYMTNLALENVLYPLVCFVVAFQIKSKHQNFHTGLLHLCRTKRPTSGISLMNWKSDSYQWYLPTERGRP